jgi:diguanylate cyclase (GGDEF)-like protein
MIALACLWQGIRVFQRRRFQTWPALVIGLGWMVLSLTPPFADSLLLRVVSVSLINAALCLAAAHELWRDRSHPLPSRQPLVVVFLSFASLMLLRACAAGVTPFPVGIGAPDSTWLAAFTLLVFAHTAFAALLFYSMTREVREAEQRSFALSDPLTGLLNRRAFVDYGERLTRRRTGGNTATALLVLDLDQFKQVNDHFGHEAGDRILEAFSGVAETSMRPSDQLFRMGGEEFCFVLPDTSLADAIAVAERLRTTFEAMEVETAMGPARATVSIGIAATPVGVGLDVLFAAADAAVYEAKARGRNRTVVAEPGSLVRSTIDGVVAPERRRA